ncbi:hypothetical protein BJ165DRAFT_1409207 [Panaeolus papilionaceus]|nr:hypothetical protein BJ165DRAFT_1409207 [Panaeolus papilionaceus]
MDIDDNPSESDGSNSEATLSDITDMESGGEETADQELIDEEPPPRSIQTFTVSQLSAIRLCITDAVIPSWTARPPTNLGEASHGKLKADEWLVLCTVFLPLILPELWYTQPFHSLLANFVHLVTCTNILSSHTVTHAYADLYTFHYTEYRRSCLELFPDINSRPNHHFAMHPGELMKFWGPLIKQSEFPGERMNGSLQKIPNNGRLRDMDYTMIRQMCRRGRLTAFVQQQQHEYTETSHQHTKARKEITAADVYRTSLNNLTRDTRPVPPKPTRDSDILPAGIYNLLLWHINSQRATQLRRYDDFPHPPDARVYSHWATPLTTVVIHNQTYSTYSQHRGNSSISFALPASQGVQTGFINSIWSQHIEGIRRTFLLVQPPIFLSDEDAARSPYFTQQLSGLMGAVVYDTVSDICIVVEPEHVQGHVPFYRRPPAWPSITSNLSSSRLGSTIKLLTLAQDMLFS